MYPDPTLQQDAEGTSPFLTSFLGLSSIFAALGMVSQAYLGSSIKLLILGSVIETGRRLFQWLIIRLRFQYSITAQFDEGDPAYQWILLFLTQENVWRRSSQFVVNATNSRRKWSVKTWADPKVKGNAEYVPTYQQPQLFRWRGRWLEIKRSNESGEARFTSAGTFQQLSSILVTMYTLDMGLLSELVEDARQRYIEVNRPNVVIHLADAPNFGPTPWSSVKQKVRRLLNSIILPEGVVDALVHDAQEFIASEDWYVEAGIPHRRGYLLYGPPGTGKTSTIYALAGALNVEIYSLSLASSFVDDAFLARAASSIPKNSIFLIEDIDCAFPSRDDEDELADFAAAPVQGGARMATPAGFPVQAVGRAVRSLVTLSGLLNVIDGVGSEEGKLFFATTNYIDRLDPALLRPGRIDHKVQYELSTEEQARALFVRFFPEARFPDFASPPYPAAANSKSAESQSQTETNESESKPCPQDIAPAPAPASAPLARDTIPALAMTFASAVPPGELSTAELQCYLQAHKATPRAAAAGVGAWVADVRAERDARKAREEERERKARARRERMTQEREGGRGREVSQKRARAREPTPVSCTCAKTKAAIGDPEAGEASPTESGSEFSAYADGALQAEDCS
ncbi:P-loop containing nucleoside triphosphate hydrolase protein [Mycena pura]|uniref:P-loop containing nucleoside triphosphate hydrolase protein n=1 Tax=Mycena pura TaxID=153505 RepID=A0AAD6Y1A5_9AGAR|nr:P-loop containing nucleoside triphosphate hydrolase protein [Mycena pura]